MSHSRVATVVLNVLDDNDEVPTFIQSSYVFRIPENRASGVSEQGLTSPSTQYRFLGDSFTGQKT